MKMHWKYFLAFLLVGIACFWRCSCAQCQGELESDKVTFHPGRVRAVGSYVTMQANYLCCANTHETWTWYLVEELPKNCLGYTTFSQSCSATPSSRVCDGLYKDRAEASSPASEDLFTLKMVLSKLELEDNGLVILRNSNSTIPTRINSSLALHVKYCDDLKVTQADIFDITNAKNGTYLTRALYYCNVSDDHYLVVNGAREDEPYYNRSCQADASWTGHNKVECWFAPKDATVHQRSKYATQSANFECDHTAGFPETKSEKYNIKNEVVNQDHILSSKDHLKSYYCTVENGYGPLQSSIKTLTVFFAPEDLDVYHLNPVIPVNKSEDFEFYFNANPKNGFVAAIVYKPDGQLENLTCRVQTDSNISYVCNFTLNVVSAADHGTYNFTAITSDPKGSNSTLVEIYKSVNDVPTTTARITEPTIGEEDPPNYALIGGLCGAALLLIILVLVFLLIRRSRLKKSATENSVKEERINEIYGSAPTTNDGAGSTQAKEERQNVLYVSSGDPGGIEEAYAEVDKRKNKKSNGNDNSAFSPEVAEVTYAAVNKPKKKKKPEDPQEAVYSAVDKKKKKKGAKGESDLHGEPTIDP